MLKIILFGVAFVIAGVLAYAGKSARYVPRPPHRKHRRAARKFSR